MKLFPFSKFEIVGDSMKPTLMPGQYVLTFNWYYLFNNPNMNDLIVVKQGDKDIIKRVKQVNIENMLWVEGDNKNYSTDSRKFGFIPLSSVQGKVVKIF